MSTEPTRRTLLVAGAAAAGTAVLAACGSSGSSTDGTPTAGPATPTADSATPGGTPDGAATSAPSSAPSSPVSGLVALASVPVGQAVAVTLPGGKPGIVARPTADTAACFSAICTHQGCTVKPAGGTLECPCHGSSFNALTGAVLGGPAPSPLPKVAVTVDDGQVTVTR